ncbi:DHH family protein [Gordonia hirsuta DSM 44140 = NBRC 16056]|uniref:DHH family protein n=1 Tax=Gordonia hirsuta DSM 44140 = NBRC 16056 TaxID=1121927 RepID=L7LCR6_9ACTN|nr:bifunctional oligoribonuclease/PAP phosphatase NrnA [Gordonia hirsuta]GAC58511.1 DHH family protein [Gordonia hirsuta DSM 44140 = NBRC 16056]
MNPASPEQIAAVLRDARRVTIISHLRPDADTIGSALALGLALTGRGARVAVSFAGPEELPATLRLLPGSDLIVAEEALEPAPVAIAVDAATTDRLGGLAAVFGASETTICIDHHVSNDGFADLDLIDPESDCTAVLVLQVLDALGADLNADIATCLFAGLVTDTGSFKWARPASFRVAGRLTEAGVDSAHWSRILLDSHPFGWLGMISGVLATAELDQDAGGGAGLVVAVLDAQRMAGMDWEDGESVVDIVRTAREADVTAVFKESQPGRWNVSLRSKSVVDLVPIARSLGGGGHTRAAGYSDSGPADEVVARLRAAL